VEDPAVWDSQYAGVEWKGNWAEDLVEAARLQVGYRESSDNYIVTESGIHKGYTRYGQFSGDMYHDWDGAFVNFCLHYAGIAASGWFPQEADTAKWQEEFIKIREENAVYFTAPSGYEPKAGDLVFLQKQNEETVNQMAIVTSYNSETGQITVIEGNSDNEVKENPYQAAEGYIISYLKMAELETAYKNNTGKADSNWALNVPAKTEVQNSGLPEGSAFLPIGNQGGGLVLELLYADKKTHSQKPEGDESYTYVDMNGYFRLSATGIQGTGQIDEFTMSLYFPAEFVTPERIGIPEFPDSFAKHEISPVTKESVDGKDYYKIGITFKDYLPTGAVEFPFHLSFLNATVPEDYQLKIFGVLESSELEENKNSMTAENIYCPIYKKPVIKKYVNTNAFESMGDDYTRVSTVLEEDNTLKDSEYVSFWYKLGSEPCYLREYEKITLTDTLPEYIDASGSTRRAVFDPEANPGWTLNEDGTVSRTFTSTAESKGWNVDSDLMEQIRTAELKLRFPDCKVDEQGEDGFLTTNLKNHIAADCAPRNPSEQEGNDTCEDDIIFTLTNQPSGEGNFAKLNSAHSIMDTEAMRSGKYRWELKLTNPSTKAFKNVVIKDEEIDKRLKIQSISIMGNKCNFIVENIQTIKAVTYDDQIVEYPSEAFSNAIYDGEWHRDLELEAEKEFKSFEVVMKDDYQMATNDTISIRPYSTFRKPKQKHFVEGEAHDLENVYINKAVAAYKIEGNEGVTSFLFSENRFKLIPSRENIWIEKSLPYFDGLQYPEKKPDGTFTYDSRCEAFCYMYVKGSLEDKAYDDMQIIDLLPETLVVPDNNISYGTNGKYIKDTEIIENYHNSGRTAIIFHMNSDELKKALGASENGNGTVLFTFKLRVADNATPGNYTNKSYLLSKDFEEPPIDHGQIQDIYDLDSDGNREESIRYAEAQSTLKAPSGIYSEKYIAMKGSDAWRKSKLRLNVGDNFRYKLSINNITSTANQNLVVYDVLPQINDRSINNLAARGSEFTVKLSAPITPPDGYHALYTDSDAVYQRDMEAILGSSDIKWTRAEEIDLNNVTAFKIVADSGTELPGNARADFIIPVKVTDVLLEDSYDKLNQKQHADKESGTVACLEATNSFGYRTSNFYGNNLESNYVKAEIAFAGFVIKKVESFENKPLAAAQFKLEKQNGDSWELVQFKESKEDGIVSFTNLTEGAYRLTETKAPNGYSILKEPIAVNIILDRSTMEYKVDIPGNEHAGNTSDPFLVVNQAYYELPNAGGQGVYWYSIGGILMLLAGVWCVYRERQY
jgi:LPXTG-motif cell wall-anchored protein